MGVPTLMERSISVGTPVERHQNQAIAQKLGILGEKVTSMTGLRIEKYLLGPI